MQTFYISNSPLGDELAIAQQLMYDMLYRARGMGANRFLKLGGLELVSRGAPTFFKPPQFISKPLQF